MKNFESKLASLVENEQRLFTAKWIAQAFNPYRKRARLPLLLPPTEPFSLPDTILENPEGFNEDNWFCLYSYGISFREFRVMFGTDPGSPPSVYDNDWWLQPREDHWAAKSDVVPGYYLISLKGRFGKTSWADQNDRIIQEMGQGYERTSEHLVAEAYFSIWVANNCGWPWDIFFWHWGKAIDSTGQRICIALSSCQLLIDSCKPEYNKARYLQVCITRRSVS